MSKNRYLYYSGAVSRIIVVKAEFHPCISPLVRGVKKAMRLRRAEGALLFLAPLTRGGRGGCSFGKGFFNKPPQRGSEIQNRFPGTFQQPNAEAIAPPRVRGGDAARGEENVAPVRKTGVVRQSRSSRPQMASWVSASKKKRLSSRMPTRASSPMSTLRVEGVRAMIDKSSKASSST